MHCTDGAQISVCLVEPRDLLSAITGLNRKTTQWHFTGPPSNQLEMSLEPTVWVALSSSQELVCGMNKAAEKEPTHSTVQEF